MTQPSPWGGPPPGPGYAPPGPPAFVPRNAGPSMLVRALWYIFLGWWLTGWAIAIGYVAAVTIVGLPVAFWIFNRIPAILTLRPRNTVYAAQLVNGMAMYVEVHHEQYPMMARALWFVLVGWWAGAIWMSLAYALCLTIIGIPIGLLMFNRVGGVMTLLRY